MANSKPDHTAAAALYKPGQVLSLALGQSMTAEMRVQIRELFQPCTLSICMAVDVLDNWGAENDVPTRACLKLLDRRVADELRRGSAIKPWTPSIEKSYRAAPEHHMFQFIQKLQHVDSFVAETGENWNEAEDEAYLANEMLRQHDAEVEAYRRLRRYQGHQIPRLYTAVYLSTTTSNENGEHGDNAHHTHNQSPPASQWQKNHLFSVSGLLMEYIPGFHLDEFASMAPRSAWQGIVDLAVRDVRILGDHGVANEDMRPHNFLVVPLGSQQIGGGGGIPYSEKIPTHHHYRVVMIDFGMCRFWTKALSAFQWGRLKANLEEENAIGLIMQLKMKNAGFELQYHDSGRYDEFAERENEPEGMFDPSLMPGGGSMRREPLRETSI